MKDKSAIVSSDIDNDSGNQMSVEDERIIADLVRKIRACRDRNREKMKQRPSMLCGSFRDIHEPMVSASIPVATTHKVRKSGEEVERKGQPKRRRSFYGVHRPPQDANG